jgi:hypothetical protein
VTRPAARTVLAVILTSLVIPGTASQVVEIRLRGHYFSAPATVVVNIAIEPAADNYRLVIEADSPKFFRSSKIELTGSDDKRIHTIQFKNLPEGAYMLRAEVQSRTAVLGQASQELTVMGGGL